MKLTSDQISDIPYVLFINDKGQGWTLNRQYKLQYSNIGDWDGLKRTVLKGLLPLAKKVEQGYPICDREATPSWVNRHKVGKQGHEYKTYWFDQLDKKVQEAYYIPFINVGVTYHFDKAGNIVEELKVRKAAQRAEITENHRKEFGIRKPFFSDGSIRFYLDSSLKSNEDIVRQWNDGWWTTERFTKKELDRVIEDIIKHLKQENTKGVFHIHLEGQYTTCTSFEDAEASLYEPWGDHFSVNHIVTIVL
jgi:hypothetical protein